MEGNQCSRLLKKALLLYGDLPDHLKNFAVALNCLNAMQDACFGNDLKSDFKTKLQQFKDAYLDIGISVTPKVHILFQHVSEFCELKQSSLGKYFEQSTESLHHDFNQTWARYKMSMQHDLYPEKLLKTVVNYNAFHV